MKSNMAPVACNPPAYNVPGTFTFLANRPNWMTCPWTYFFKWNISAPGSCGRVPVQALLNCSAPVEFMSFEATLEGKVVSLDWLTSDEIDVSYYEVQKSLDGINFYPIGKVTASGNNNMVTEYSFSDPVQSTGIVYYRIAEYDKDGHVNYSEVRFVRPHENINLQIVPNPTKGLITITGNINRGEEVSIKVLNVLGEIIYELNEENTSDIYSQTIDLGNEAGGMYYVYLCSQSEKVCRKILKE